MALKDVPKPSLTRREREVAALVAEGLTNREIAQRLFISERTADGHLEHIREKLGISSRAQVAAWFVQQSNGALVAAGVVSPPQRGRRTLRLGALAGALALPLVVIAALNYPRWGPVAPSGPSVDTLAGNSRGDHYQGGYSGDFGPARAAQLSHPLGVAITRDGVYIADSVNRVIRKVDRGGVITTVAGGGSVEFADGANATSVMLPQPAALAVAPDGRLFFCSGPSIYRIDLDATLHRVRLSTSSPPLLDAAGLAIDDKGTIYIADRAANTVRRLGPDSSLSTYAGTGEPGFSGDGGAASGALLRLPVGLALDAAGNLFIADQGNNRIRRVDRETGIITTIAGSDEIYGFAGDNGPAIRAKLSLPSGVTVGDGWIYIADTGNNRVRQVSPGGVITTLAGTGDPGLTGDGGPALAARFFGPWGLGIDTAGALLVADSGNNRVRVIHLHTSTR